LAKHHYVGKAGPLAVMSEIALRGYNVALPEIDVGDDIFGVSPDSGKLTRVQVKTASGRKGKKTTTYQFRIRRKVINTGVTPDLVFVFAMRHCESWRFMVLKRFVLKRLCRKKRLGSANGDFRVISVSCRGDRWTGAKIPLDVYMENWSPWPRLT